jgi:hypothetical protein
MRQLPQDWLHAASRRAGGAVEEIAVLEDDFDQQQPTEQQLVGRRIVDDEMARVWDAELR